MGYNGPPPGEPHCYGNTCSTDSDRGCMRSLHAEANAVIRALKKTDMGLSHCDLYSTASPCMDCAIKIKDAQVRRVFYRHPYRLRDGLQFLLVHNVPVYRVLTSGVVIDESTGKITEL